MSRPGTTRLHKVNVAPTLARHYARGAATDVGRVPRFLPGTHTDSFRHVLTNGDGLLTLDRKLYVVQNQSNLVAVFRLDHGATSGVLKKTLTNPDFDVPTTVAKFGKWLYLPNARFSTTPTPDTTYTAARVKR